MKDRRVPLTDKSWPGSRLWTFVQTTSENDTDTDGMLRNVGVPEVIPGLPAQAPATEAIFGTCGDVRRMNVGYSRVASSRIETEKGMESPSCLPSELPLPDGPPIFGGEDNQVAALDGPDSVWLWRVLPSTLRIQDASCFPLPKFGAKVLTRLVYEFRCLIGAKLILHADILTGDSAYPATQFRAV